MYLLPQMTKSHYNWKIEEHSTPSVISMQQYMGFRDMECRHDTCNTGMANRATMFLQQCAMHCPVQ